MRYMDGISPITYRMGPPVISWFINHYLGAPFSTPVMNGSANEWNDSRNYQPILEV